MTAKPGVFAVPVPKLAGDPFNSDLRSYPFLKLFVPSDLSKGKRRRLSAPDRESNREPGPAELGLRFALPRFSAADRDRLVLVQLHARRWVTDEWLEAFAGLFAWLALVRNAKVVYGVGMFAQDRPAPPRGCPETDDPDLAGLLSAVEPRGRVLRRPQGRDAAALQTSVVARWRAAVFHAPGGTRFAKGSAGKMLAEHGVTAAERAEYFAEKAARAERKKIARRRRENEAARLRRAAKRAGPRFCHDCFAVLALARTGRPAKRCPACARAHKAARRKNRSPGEGTHPRASGHLSTSTEGKHNPVPALGKPQ